MPNIVLIVLESFHGEYCHFLNSSTLEITPNLSHLADAGINFSHCYANGVRSAFGLSSIFCSMPALPGRPLMYQTEAIGRLQTGASLLKEIGYETTMLYGGDASYDNLSGFAFASGFEKVIDRHDFPDSADGTVWGVYDHFLFERLLNELEMNDHPKFMTAYTTSSHPPWKIPDSYVADIGSVPDSLFTNRPVQSSMAYVDQVVGEFMEKAQERDWYKNSIFVFTADHGINAHKDMEDHIRNGHIPFLIFQPGGENKDISTVVSQVDIIPTILDLIRYPQAIAFFGRSGFEQKPGFALRVINDHWQWITDSLMYDEHLNEPGRYYSYGQIHQPAYLELMSPDSFALAQAQNAHAYLQSAWYHFKQ